MSNITEMPVGNNPLNKSRKTYDREKVAAEIQTDYKFTSFYLCPHILEGKPWQEFADRVSISEEVAEIYAEKLLATGLWVQTSNGIAVTKGFLDLGDLDIGAFLSMTLNITSRMSETGPCWYDSYMVATTDNLRKEFYKEINRAFINLIERSAQTKPEVLLAWSHSSLYDSLTPTKENKN